MAGELVAGEAEDLEVGVGGMDVWREGRWLVGGYRSGYLVTYTTRTLVELLEAFELRREAAFAGCVHDEDHLALEGSEIILGALLVLGLEVVERGGGSHGCVGSVAILLLDRWVDMNFGRCGYEAGNRRGFMIDEV